MTASPFLQRVAQTCRRCPRPVVFVRTEGGKAMPVDLESDIAGNVAVYVDGGGVVRGRVVSAERPVEAHEELHVPHFATCGVTKVGQPRSDNVVPLYRARAVRRARTPP